MVHFWTSSGWSNTYGKMWDVLHLHEHILSSMQRTLNLSYLHLSWLLLWNPEHCAWNTCVSQASTGFASAFCCIWWPLHGYFKMQVQKTFISPDACGNFLLFQWPLTPSPTHLGIVSSHPALRVQLFSDPNGNFLTENNMSILILIESSGW